jgi:hypothetical protein
VHQSTITYDQNDLVIERRQISPCSNSVAETPTPQCVGTKLALFAAACLNLGAECAPGYWNLMNGDIWEEFADRLVEQAQTWLASNLPRFGYATEVENLIAQASAIPA